MGKTCTNEVEGSMQSVLVHLASGIGNIVLATPLLVALNQMDFVIDLLIHADYPAMAELFRDWSVVRKVCENGSKEIKPISYSFIIPAIPPFYWARFARLFENSSRIIPRPKDELFYKNEQEYYLTFARVLGYPVVLKPFYCLPIGPTDAFGVTGKTLVIAPGCKTGEMAAKRWPYFPQLAESFPDVAIVGRGDDLSQNDGTLFRFPRHVRSFVDKLTLRKTAELLAGAGVVVGNDSGLSLIAAAMGTPTVMLFGPTPHLTLGQFPPNVKVLRAGLPCESCWFGARFRACAEKLDCLRSITVSSVVREIRTLIGLE